ncbi:MULTISPECIES: SusC/RagA family TonB-linked outer membrane protein [unclassified Spirosoma]|uniref:SusC/RagA family TonB-linked outer membrane protein n=1 Tax=unclassified Spirosoma TaxID=2621999 RepID=UPI00096802C0|nr:MULTISPECIES: SusC/RagA family TonB-linked outer membrane protein [unclassified Spirosoma]MBN8825462.1 SusC/RagA family TonB-linked outer membrane protein [Spirosoma sp.]OJW74972.1 MAG: SusC/RagA family TonB-linked outer membrane protein [Spirosoma sp. 48-14]
MPTYPKTTRRYVILIISLFICLTGWAQPISLTGTVRDKRTGEGLPGVNVTIKGATRGTVSDSDGRFSLPAQQGDVLVVSQIGMATQEIPVGNQTTLTIDLAESARSLDEVVVVGYGQQSRRTLTGSVASIDNTVLKSVPRTNAATALQGTAPGLRVQQTSGQPGSTPTIVLRGGTDFSGSGTPLYVVDGVIVPSLYGINAQDIEKMDVLKDAASTAIYGARAANGVILVTTKKGKKGRTSVTYTFKHAANYIRRNPLQYMSAEDYIKWNRRGLASRYAAAQADNNTAEMNNTRNQLTGAWGWGLNSGWTAPDGKYSTQQLTNTNRSLLNDPQYHLLVDQNPFNPAQMDSILYRSTTQRELEDLILQTGVLNEHYLNASGGNDMGNFSLGVGSLSDQGIIIGSGLKRLNLNFNGGLNVGKNLTIGLNLAAYNASSTPSYLTADASGSLSGGLVQRFTGIAPTVRLTRDGTGEQLPGVDGSTLGNPAYFSDKFINNTNEQRYSGGLNVEYRLAPFLKVLGSASGYYRYTTNDQFTKAYINGTGGALVSTRNASFSNVRTSQYTYNGFLQYDKDFGLHTISVLGGGEFYEYRQYSYGASANLAATDFIPWLSASTAAVGIPTSAFNSWQRLASGIGRINYNYADKYLLTLNMRYDGTSKLTTNRYGFFPGVSAGWNMSNETFFANSPLKQFVSVLKPRISWGVNGSINPLDASGNPIIGDYATTPQYANVGIYNGQPGFAASGITNTDLRWERASTLNIGLDLGLFNNRVTFIADYFIRNVYDKISTLNIPGWTGYNSYVTNLGQLQNRGIELDIRTQIIRPKTEGGLSWSVNANLYSVKNFAIKLPNNGLPLNRQSASQVFDPTTNQLVWVGGLQEGKRIGLDQVYAPIYDGIYTTQAELDSRANFYNSYLPYTNKRIKLLGDARWRDLDRNDSLDYRDFVYVGRTTPTVQGGFSSNLSWKGFTLFGQFDYSLGFVILNQSYLRGLSQVQGSQNGPVDITNTWSPDNPTGTLPRYYWANYARNYFTDAGGSTTAPANFWQKGNYVALRELTLSYDTPAQLLERLSRKRVQGLRVFLTGSNLVYFTKYNGTFPEVGGNDVGRFPLPRTVTLGATISL